MNTADVANQQVLAAWIAAGAAVVQAIGAIAAIIVSIQLARSSARREREAEESAARRLEAADRAQRDRDAAADQAAEARVQREKAAAHNGLIERITSLGILATDQCRSEVDEGRANYADVSGTIIGGGLTSRRLAELREALPLVKNGTGDVELLEAISVLQDRIVWEKVETVGGGNYVVALEGKLDQIFDALFAIEALRR